MNINWNLILKSLRANKCLLVIGHDAVKGTNAKNPVFHNALQTLAESFPDDVVYHDGDEFMYVNPSIDVQAYNEIADEFISAPTPTIFNQIAEIPFSIYLNISPDIYLKNILDTKSAETGAHFIYDYYQPQELPGELPKADGEMPLLYNLFGTVKQPETMVFSYDRLFNYLDSMMTKNYKLHSSVVSQIRDCTSILFVGFKFNRVYLNLLLWILGFQTIKQKKIASGKMYEEALDFVKNHFAVEYISEDIPGFIQQLHKECMDNSMLRTFKPAAPPAYNGHLPVNGSSKLKNELLILIEELEYDKLFSRLLELDVKSAKINLLRDEHILNRKSVDYEDRLFTFVNTLNL